MSHSTVAGPLLPSETQIRDAIWERVGNQNVDEVRNRLGFNPEMKTMGGNRVMFEDSGVEVTMWLNSAKKISMINVRRL